MMPSKIGVIHSMLKVYPLSGSLAMVLQFARILRHTAPTNRANGTATTVQSAAIERMSLRVCIIVSLSVSECKAKTKASGMREQTSLCFAPAIEAGEPYSILAVSRVCGPCLANDLPDNPCRSEECKHFSAPLAERLGCSIPGVSQAQRVSDRSSAWLLLRRFWEVCP